MNPLEDEIAKCIGVLADAGGELYEVGGPVRDGLLGRPVKDRDFLCRRLPMKRVCALLAAHGKVAGVGKSFGIIKFSPRRRPDIVIDIALPRRERSTGVKHRDFEVDFDPDMPVEEDLGRRDFTINAMARRISDSQLIDPFGGARDLSQGLLRMVFPRAFEEDPLRLIRAVQFAARFGLRIEPATWESMKEHAHLIKTVSGERIGIELVKLMGAQKPSQGFELLSDSGLLAHVLPEIAAIKGIEQDKQPGDDVYSHTMRSLDAARSDDAVEHRGDINLMFAVLLHDTGKAKTARFHAPAGRIVFFGHQLVSRRLAERAMERLKLSAAGVDPRLVQTLIEHHMFETKANFTERAIRRFVSKVGKETIFMLTDLRIADNRGGKHPAGIKGVLKLRKRIAEELAKKPPFGPRDLAIDGHALMALGIPEGPALGAVIAALVDRTLDDPSLNTRDKLLALAREILDNSAVADLASGRMRSRRAAARADKADVKETQS